MTNEEINALTDQQINVMMTISINSIDKSRIEHIGDTCLFVTNHDRPEGADCYLIEDFCNNPSVMMPIVFENGIGLFPNRMGLGESDLWTAAYSIYKRNNYTHTNPLRAAAIVYLKMKGVL